MQKSTILILDDDPDVREALAEQFHGQEDMRAESAARDGPGIAAAAGQGVGLVLVDIENGADCTATLDALHAGGARAPVIVLVAEADEDAGAAALDAGAADYLTKPFKFSRLLARIRSLLRSQEQGEDASVRIGPYEFHPALKAMVWAPHEAVRLTEKETAILRYLYRCGDRSVSREELLREVWGYNSGVTTHTLETHIYRLRQKIEPEVTSPRLLITETGGYRLQP